MEVLQLLNMLWRRKGVIAMSIAFFLGVGIVASLLLPRQYYSTTELLVASDDSTMSMLNELGLSEMAMSLTSGSDEITDKIYLSTTEPMVEEVIWRLQLRDSKGRLYQVDDVLGSSTIAKITGTPTIMVSQISGTSALLVESTGPTDHTARLMADTLAQVYIDQQLEQARQETSNAQAFIDEQIGTITRKLDDTFVQMARERREIGIVDVEAEVKATLTRLSELLSERVALEGKVSETRARIREAEAYRARETVDSVSPTTLTTNPVVGSLRSRLSELRSRRLGLLNEMTELHPDVVQVDAEIAATEAELKTALTETASMDTVTQGLKADLAGLIERLDEVDSAIISTQEELIAYPEKMRDMERLELDASAAEEVYKNLQDESFEIAIAKAMTVADVRVVEAAELPEKPSSPLPLLNVVLGLFLGVAFGGVSALALEYVDDSIKDGEDLRHAWDLVQLGTIPRYKASRAPALATLPPTDPLAEAHRAIRNGIAFATLDNPARAVAFTSSIPGEGKSTVVSNVALSMARDGKRVLLVDADLRLPVQHKTFPELVIAPGLAEVLTRRCEIEEAIQPTPVEGLFVLAAGDLPADPGNLVESLRMQKVLQELTREFDAVFVDTPPVLAVQDALAVARMVDQIVVVVEAARVTGRMLADVRGRFESAGLAPVGLVLNKVRGSATHYGAYARYYQKASEGRKKQADASEEGAA